MQHLQKRKKEIEKIIEKMYHLVMVWASLRESAAHSMFLFASRVF